MYVPLNQHPLYFINLSFSLHIHPHHFNLEDNSYCLGHSSTSELISLHLVQCFSMLYSQSPRFIIPLSWWNTFKWCIRSWWFDPFSPPASSLLTVYSLSREICPHFRVPHVLLFTHSLPNDWNTLHCKPLPHLFLANFCSFFESQLWCCSWQNFPDLSRVVFGLL